MLDLLRQYPLFCIGVVFIPVSFDTENDVAILLGSLRLGVEVVEYNPYHDKNQKTERLIQEILLSIFGVQTK